ncbi:DUF3857 domain-containing protein [Gaetbulibacter aestuarii]|uniref:DUF3857 domain-containing protein n=1 Tax=Gaetbulibacter aestuarii TaxID=1502358 RepID=A0ABW7N048_9FLAO
MNKLNYLVFLFVGCQLSLAQDIKFGAISKEELTETEYLQDKSANAAILYRNRNTYYDMDTGNMITEVHQRIKIYNKEGFGYATVKLKLFKLESEKETVGRLKAYTYNLEGNKIVETKLDKDQIFQNEISFYYNSYSFSMPNVKEGSVLEYRYTITSPFFSVDEFKFQYDIPVKKLEARLKTPKQVTFRETVKGFLNVYSRPGDGYGENKVLEYSLDHIPALKEEEYVDNMDNYRSGVMFEAVSIEIPGRLYRNFATSWKDVAKTIGSSHDYENELDKTRSFDDELDALLEGVVKPEDKMKLLFKYVKEHITWNGMDGRGFFNGIKKALKEKKGNAGDINLTLVAMLRYAGIDANPVVISTKDNFMPLFPTVNRLNYVLAYARVNDKPYFMDATNEFSDINILPVKDYNWQGVLIDNPNLKWDLVPIQQPKKSVEQYLLSATLNEDGTMEGKFNSRYLNHGAYLKRQELKNEDMDSYIASREAELGNIEIEEYNIENTDKYEGYVSESFNFYLDRGAESMNNKLFINPFIFFKTDENPFKKEKREFPIDFGVPFSNKYSISINIPDGYSVESKPEPIIISLPDGLGKFMYIPKIMGKNIQLMVNFEINSARMGPDNYLYLKELFNQMIVKEAEQIVLSKA